MNWHFPKENDVSLRSYLVGAQADTFCDLACKPAQVFH